MTGKTGGNRIADQLPCEMDFALNDTAIYPLSLDLPEGRIEARIELSRNAERLVDLTFKMLDISSVAADMGARAAHKLGLKVSCRMGCGHCCRQLVPLSAPEAAMVFEFVKTMPEPRRSVVSERFSAAGAHLQKMGLISELERLQHPDLSDREQKDITRKYFEEKIACPFLEDESCSIYPVRPSMCREYLVCSPADHCRDPYGHRIDKLPVSMRLSQALSHVWAELTKTRPMLIPFILALQWTADNAHSRTVAVKSGPLLHALLQQISKTAAGIEL
jgi:Fe-S-cluster containining protein